MNVHIMYGKFHTEAHDVRLHHFCVRVIQWTKTIKQEMRRKKMYATRYTAMAWQIL